MTLRSNLLKKLLASTLLVFSVIGIGSSMKVDAAEDGSEVIDVYTEKDYVSTNTQTLLISNSFAIDPTQPVTINVLGTASDNKGVDSKKTFNLLDASCQDPLYPDFPYVINFTNFPDRYDVIYISYTNTNGTIYKNQTIFTGPYDSKECVYNAVDYDPMVAYIVLPFRVEAAYNRSNVYRFRIYFPGQGQGATDSSFTVTTTIGDQLIVYKKAEFGVDPSRSYKIPGESNSEEYSLVSLKYMEFYADPAIFNNGRIKDATLTFVAENSNSTYDYIVKSNGSLPENEMLSSIYTSETHEAVYVKPASGSSYVSLILFSQDYQNEHIVYDPATELVFSYFNSTSATFSSSISYIPTGSEEKTTVTNIVSPGYFLNYWTIPDGVTKFDLNVTITPKNGGTVSNKIISLERDNLSKSGVLVFDDIVTTNTYKTYGNQEFEDYLKDHYLIAYTSQSGLNFAFFNEPSRDVVLGKVAYSTISTTLPLAKGVQWAFADEKLFGAYKQDNTVNLSSSINLSNVATTTGLDYRWCFNFNSTTGVFTTKVAGTYHIEYDGVRLIINKTDASVDIISKALSFSNLVKLNYVVGVASGTTSLLKIYKDEARSQLVGSYETQLNSEDYTKYVQLAGQVVSLSTYADDLYLDLYSVNGEEETKMYSEVFALDDYLKSLAGNELIDSFFALCEADRLRVNEASGTTVNETLKSNVLEALKSKAVYKATSTGGLSFTHTDLAVDDDIKFGLAFNYDPKFGKCTVVEKVGETTIHSDTFEDTIAETKAYYGGGFYYANFGATHTVTITGTNASASVQINGFTYIYLGLKQSTDPNVINELLALYDFATKCIATLGA